MEVYQSSSRTLAFSLSPMPGGPPNQPNQAAHLGDPVVLDLVQQRTVADLEQLGRAVRLPCVRSRALRISVSSITRLVRLMGKATTPVSWPRGRALRGIVREGRPPPKGPPPQAPRHARSCSPARAHCPGRRSERGASARRVIAAQLGAEAAVVLGQESARSRRQVPAALPQGGQRDLEHVQSVVEIFAKAGLFHFARQVAHVAAITLTSTARRLCSPRRRTSPS